MNDNIIEEISIFIFMIFNNLYMCTVMEHRKLNG